MIDYRLYNVSIALCMFFFANQCGLCRNKSVKLLSSKPGGDYQHIVGESLQTSISGGD
jgi:hypothetical protein